MITNPIHNCIPRVTRIPEIIFIAIIRLTSLLAARRWEYMGPPWRGSRLPFPFASIVTSHNIFLFDEFRPRYSCSDTVTACTIFYRDVDVTFVSFANPLTFMSFSFSSDKLHYALFVSPPTSRSNPDLYENLCLLVIGFSYAFFM